MVVRWCRNLRTGIAHAFKPKTTKSICLIVGNHDVNAWERFSTRRCKMCEKILAQVRKGKR